MKKKAIKLLVIVLLIIGLAILYTILQFGKYSSDITATEKEALENYYYPDTYFSNYIVIGEEKVNEKQTNYYAVAYINPFEKLSNGAIKMTPYLEMSSKQLSGCKADDKYALEIFETEKEGKDLIVLKSEQGISTEGNERSEYARWPMMLKARFYHASKDELRQMDEANNKRMKDLGYHLD